MLSQFWRHFSSKNTRWGEQKWIQKSLQKRIPPKSQTSTYLRVRRLLGSPPRVRVFWTRNNSLSKKQQQLLIAESISEICFGMGSFWVNLWKKDVLMKIIKRQIVADYIFLIVSCQRPVIWHALGQGPASLILSFYFVHHPPCKLPPWKRIRGCRSFSFL